MYQRNIQSGAGPARQYLYGGSLGDHPTADDGWQAADADPASIASEMARTLLAHMRGLNSTFTGSCAVWWSVQVWLSPGAICSPING